ncbi:hypothetical protein BGX24_005934, partial [Mortierella sp. AD032]
MDYISTFRWKRLTYQAFDSSVRTDSDKEVDDQDEEDNCQRRSRKSSQELEDGLTEEEDESKGTTIIKIPSPDNTAIPKANPFSSPPQSATRAQNFFKLLSTPLPQQTLSSDAIPSSNVHNGIYSGGGTMTSGTTPDSESSGSSSNGGVQIPQISSSSASTTASLISITRPSSQLSLIPDKKPGFLRKTFNRLAGRQVAKVDTHALTVEETQVRPPLISYDPLFRHNVPAMQVQADSVSLASFPQDIFPKNLRPATLRTPLPKPRARIEQTTQLVYCYQLLSIGQISSPASDADGFGVIPLDEAQQEWVQLLDPMELDHLGRIIEKLVRAFIEGDFKDSTAIAEMVLLGPILERELYRSVLSCFISQFEQTKLLHVTLLQGLVQLVECAFRGYLVDGDLIMIASVISKELSLTHNGTSDHVLLLTQALVRVLDVMVAGNVKDLNRNRDHQPMLQLLGALRDSDNVYLSYQAAYAIQALLHIPDDETPLRAMWRYSEMATTSASVMTSVFKLDSEDNFNTVKRRSWYLALQETALLIRQGRLYDFKQVVLQVPFRHDVNFQWGVCRQLGEIAFDPLWDDEVRQQAVDFLGDIYRRNTYWEPQEDVKRWILTILFQISRLQDSLTEDR